MARTHFEKFSIENDGIKIHVNLRSVDAAVKRAQYALDGAVMQGMQDYMPMVSGDFIDRTQIANESLQGTGMLYAGVGPFGRYLYEGKVMVDGKTGKGPRNIPGIELRYREGAKLMATQRELEFNKLAHPDAQKEWFLAAKKEHLKSWIQVAQDAVNGG